MAAGQRICIVADYDCDGATACAVGLRGLRLLGAPMGYDGASYLVPDRVTDGYGLTPSIAKRVKASGADVLVTVDNGIASLDGVRAARELGLQVIVTDHHLPALKNGEIVVPDDCIIVNPNQPGCGFESKSIAGVGVMFYVLLALRAELRERGVFTPQTQPKIDALLPLVALGTVADVVKLDANNRRLVAQGLKRVRAGAMPPGMTALFNVAARKYPAATGFDFGFALGPRLNAAGRLADMTLGIECLTTDDALRADELARTLDGINRERKAIEGDMRDQALALVEEMFDESEEPPPAMIVFDPDFHEGVVGIVASRLKDKLHRPTFVFAASGAEGKEHELKGSGRSIPGFHLRDALDLVAKRHPGVLLRFGGHAMAAGCTIEEEHLETFEAALQLVAHEWLDAATLRAPHGSRRRARQTVPPHRSGRHPAQGSLGPGLCAARVLRRSADREPAAGGRKTPGAENETPGRAGGRHLVRPHRAAARAGQAGVPAGRRRVARAAAGKISRRSSRALNNRKTTMPVQPADIPNLSHFELAEHIRLSKVNPGLYVGLEDPLAGTGRSEPNPQLPVHEVRTWKCEVDQIRSPGRSSAHSSTCKAPSTPRRLQPMRIYRVLPRAGFCWRTGDGFRVGQLSSSSR